MLDNISPREVHVEDQSILKHIGALVDEDHAILRHEAEAGRDPTHHSRLTEIEETLDQLWDLLRRRRAARRARTNPDDVEPRDRRLVEKYLQ